MHLTLFHSLEFSVSIISSENDWIWPCWISKLIAAKKTYSLCLEM
uniref:Uncharacterized protein n=1 Tax=Arundo donax TaxID=35708 RepID=A0A0A9H6P9_ARUDO